MTAAHPTPATLPPLVLGASGRIGQGFRELARSGHWPGPVPLWQMRRNAVQPGPDVLEWDILDAPPPDAGPVSGVIALAGPTRGALGQTTPLAIAAIDLGLRAGGVPVLLASSSAVYGGQSGPVSEMAATTPTSDYGRAKLEMERAVTAHVGALGPDAPQVCILRIGNVAGADAVLQAAMAGPVTLDRFGGGQGPLRSYIGMRDLAGVMTGLLALAATGGRLPAVLNVGAPTPVDMADLLRAAGSGWTWRPAPVTALARMTLDCTLLRFHLPGLAVSGDPADLVAQARLAGWQPA